MVGYTGNTHTLFELQNQRVCYDFLKSKLVEREPLSIPLILEVHRILTAGAYDEQETLDVLVSFLKEQIPAVN